MACLPSFQHWVSWSIIFVHLGLVPELMWRCGLKCVWQTEGWRAGLLWQTPPNERVWSVPDSSCPLDWSPGLHNQACLFPMASTWGFHFLSVITKPISHSSPCPVTRLPCHLHPPFFCHNVRVPVFSSVPHSNPQHNGTGGTACLHWLRRLKGTWLL